MINDIIRKHAILSQLMENREKLETDDVIDKELTVTDFDFAESNKGAFVVLIFKEFPNSFYFGGSVLTEFFSDFTEEDRNELYESGGLVVKLKRVKSKTKNPENGMYNQYVKLVF